MKYQICTKTVLDTTYPNITFDHEGICNHYYEYHNKVKKNIKNEIVGNIEFKKIASQVKKSRGNSEFDCILGLSGGLDSSFMLHKIVTEYDLKPLVFHVDGGWNSEISTNNIYNMVDKLGLELFTEVINWNEMREFQLSFFKSGVPHLDIPQDHAFISVLYNFAEKYNIKYILNGGNISTEAVIMPYKYYYWGTDLKQIHDITSKYCSIDLKEYPFSSVFRHKLYLKYFKGVKVIKPLNYSELVGTIKNCYALLTDSGGLQEEAPSLGKPVLVLRKTTERPEAIAAGTAKLIGTDPLSILRETGNILTNKKAYQKMSIAINPFGDGKASERILKICKEFLNI